MSHGCAHSPKPEPLTRGRRAEGVSNDSIIPASSMLILPQPRKSHIPQPHRAHAAQPHRPSSLIAASATASVRLSVFQIGYFKIQTANTSDCITVLTIEDGGRDSNSNTLRSVRDNENIHNSSAICGGTFSCFSFLFISTSQ